MSGGPETGSYLQMFAFHPPKPIFGGSCNFFQGRES